jgi:hypothetical protein
VYRSALLAIATISIHSAGTVAVAQTHQNKAIYTASETGAYHTSFCPSLHAVLVKAGLHEYVCTPSGGTPDNLSKVLANPQALGFAQLDVLARWAIENSEAAKAISATGGRSPRYRSPPGDQSGRPGAAMISLINTVLLTLLAVGDGRHHPPTEPVRCCHSR